PRQIAGALPISCLPRHPRRRYRPYGENQSRETARLEIGGGDAHATSTAWTFQQGWDKQATMCVQLRIFLPRTVKSTLECNRVLRPNPQCNYDRANRFDT